MLGKLILVTKKIQEKQAKEIYLKKSMPLEKVARQTQDFPAKGTTVIEGAPSTAAAPVITTEPKAPSAPKAKGAAAPKTPTTEPSKHFLVEHLGQEHVDNLNNNIGELLQAGKHGEAIDLLRNSHYAAKSKEYVKRIHEAMGKGDFETATNLVKEHEQFHHKIKGIVQPTDTAPQPTTPPPANVAAPSMPSAALSNFANWRITNSSKFSDLGNQWSGTPVPIEPPAPAAETISSEPPTETAPAEPKKQENTMGFLTEDKAKAILSAAQSRQAAQQSSATPPNESTPETPPAAQQPSEQPNSSKRIVVQGGKPNTRKPKATRASVAVAQNENIPDPRQQEQQTIENIEAVQPLSDYGDISESLNDLGTNKYLQGTGTKAGTPQERIAAGLPSPQSQKKNNTNKQQGKEKTNKTPEDKIVRAAAAIGREKWEAQEQKKAEDAKKRGGDYAPVPYPEKADEVRAQTAAKNQPAKKIVVRRGTGKTKNEKNDSKK